MGSGLDSDRLTALSRVAQDVGVAAILGGNLFGRLAMHPAVRRVSDARERGAVVNAAWRRYGTVNGLALFAVVAGWASTRASVLRSDPGLARAKDVAVGATAVTGLAAAIEGMRFDSLEPGGSVPLADGSHPAPEASATESRAKRTLSALGAANLASTLALAVVNSAIADRSRSPGLRGRLVRR